MDRGGWWAAVHGVSQLKRLSTHAHIFCKPRLFACFAHCVQKRQTLANTISICPLSRPPWPVGAKEMGLWISRGVGTGDWAMSPPSSSRRD